MDSEGSRRLAISLIRSISESAIREFEAKGDRKNVEDVLRCLEKADEIEKSFDHN